MPETTEIETETARLEFVAYAAEIGSDAMTEETAILGVGREFLPEHARVVLDGGAATAEYYAWLRSQTEAAQAEHDREYAAGHEHQDDAVREASWRAAEVAS